MVQLKIKIQSLYLPIKMVLLFQRGNLDISKKHQTQQVLLKKDYYDLKRYHSLYHNQLLIINY